MSDATDALEWLDSLISEKPHNAAAIIRGLKADLATAQAKRDQAYGLLTEVWAWYGDIVRHPERKRVDWDSLEEIRAKSHTLTKIGETAS